MGVGLVGFGTIGTGVARILLGERAAIGQRTGCDIELVKICDKDLVTDRKVAGASEILTDRLDDLIADPAIDTVIELVGGLEPARTFVLKFLEAGKNVVTANKALLANHGPELFEKARACGRTIAFEAAVCGGIPILSSIATSLQANRIESIHAIVNGTSNFILSRMEAERADYSDAVREAQRLGYAEANPAMDVDGSDAVQKLTILAQLAFGAVADWKQISRTGIDTVEAIDIDFARKLGRRIRLLASAVRLGETLALKVSPTLLPETAPLAKVMDAFNGVEIVGDFVGPVFYQGLGAGERPTASAVCSDVIDTALGRTHITFQTLNLWSPKSVSCPLASAEQIVGRAYLRLQVRDRPGVLAEIAGTLGRQNISISSMMQSETIEGGDSVANLMFLTHKASEKALRSAVAELDRLEFVVGKTVRLAVAD